MGADHRHDHHGILSIEGVVLHLALLAVEGLDHFLLSMDLANEVIANCLIATAV